MSYWSLFSGLGGIDLALDRAGMTCGLQAEPNASCVSVLEKHWPDTDRIDDVNRLKAYLEPRNAHRHARKFIRPQLIAGGFPCQDVSVAGNRAGLAGARSGLWFTFRRIIALVRPEFVLIENVPGLLSSNGGRDFGTILGGLAKLRYGTAYRVLDAQFYGVPQRRRRVFIVGCLGDWERAARILFESDCLPWNPAPSRETKSSVAGTIEAGAGVRRGAGIDPGCLTPVSALTGSLGSGGVCAGRAQAGHIIANCLEAGNQRNNPTHDNFIVAPLRTSPYADNAAQESQLVVSPEQWTCYRCFGQYDKPTFKEGFSADGSPAGVYYCPSCVQIIAPQLAATITSGIATGPGVNAPGRRREDDTNLVVTPFDTTQITSPGNYSNPRAGDPCHPLAAGAHAPAVAFKSTIGRNGRGQPSETAGALLASEDGGRTDQKTNVAYSGGVRRLMPVECLRLQGLPDGHLDGLGLSDSAKYRMIGNSVAVPVVEWLANRIRDISKKPD